MMRTLILVFCGILVIQANEDDFSGFTKGNLKFSSNVYKELSKTNSGNFLVCTMSVETAFALTHAGAKGDTADEIATAFGLPLDNNEIQTIYKKMLPKLQHTGAYNLSNANKIYVKKDFKIREEFKKIAVDAFNAEAEEIDFDKKAAAVHEVNKWVEEKTYDKIHDLLSEDDISALTRLIIINAMYFKGNWLNDFSEDITTKRSFYLNEAKTVEVDMMETVHYFGYYDSKETNAQYLDMAFRDSDISMTIILPNEKQGLSTLETKIEQLLDVPNYERTRVYVRLPRFEIESTIHFIPILKQLGIQKAFGSGADFSGITEDSKLMIDKVIQKTFMKVTEQGTTAAAATAIVFNRVMSAAPPPPPPKEFFADHPFIFVLRNTEGIMFMGRYVSN